MSELVWTEAIATMAAVLAAGLAVAVIPAAFLLRRVEALRGQTADRLDELSRRIRLLESRLDLSAARPAPDLPVQDVAGPPRAGGPRLAGYGPSTPVQGSATGLARTGPTLIAVPDLAEIRDEPDLNAEADLSLRHAEVWALAETGVNPEQIARQTGQPIGQVDLIMGLYRRLRLSRGSTPHARSQ